jgi:small GTP-binding protein
MGACFPNVCLKYNQQTDQDQAIELRDIQNELELTNYRTHFIKIIIVGPPKSGKTCFKNVFVFETDNYCDEYVSTIGIDYGTNIRQVNGMEYKFDIWDVAGSAQYKPMIALCCKNCHFVLFIYDDTSEETILQDFEQEVDQHIDKSQCIKLFIHNKKNENLKVIENANSDSSSSSGSDSVPVPAPQYYVMDVSNKLNVDGFANLIIHKHNNPSIQ